MRLITLCFFIISCQALAYAQDEGCYTPRRQKGIEAYDAKDFDKAIKRWQAVLENCTDIPNNHDLNAWIAKAEAAKKPAPITTPSVSTLPYEPDMVFVQGGTFQMGSNDGESDEKPVHSVTLSDFHIGKYEITVAQYLQFCTETNTNWPEWLEKGNSYHVETGTDAYYKNKGYTRKGSDNLPIVGVSWNDVVAYTQWLSRKTSKKYRLPTEAEWEFAARGGNNSNSSKYSGSNSIENVAWYTSNSGGKTHPVGTKQANDLGIYDMSGNAWEWCSDWYGSYSSGAITNPKGASSGSSRVLRGGSWLNFDDFCRVALRGNAEPVIRNSYIGFRVCRND
jgi:formylglycine-generating enzyme